ncbi:MAG: nuclear export factor [Bacilli bacterium]|nr:nuclear export factor [Bacilli bacterium]
MKKMIVTLSALMVSMLLFAGIASAHVVVFPKETTQGTYEKFTVRVPTEKDVPTIKVELKIPADVEISSTQPVFGWKADLVKDANGKVTSIVWTATGDGLSPSEFGEFSLQGKVSAKTTSIQWKADQTYKDNSVVSWTGDEKSDHPASITKVNPVPANATVAADGDMVTTDSSTSKLPLYFSIGAAVLALLSLITVWMRKTK